MNDTLRKLILVPFIGISTCSADSTHITIILGTTFNITSRASFHFLKLLSISFYDLILLLNGKMLLHGKLTGVTGITCLLIRNKIKDVEYQDGCAAIAVLLKTKISLS